MSATDSSGFHPETEPHEHAWDAASGDPRGRCFAFAGSDMLVLGTPGATSEVPSWDDLRAWNISAIRYQYLGTLGGEPCWSAELPPGVQLPERAELSGLRTLYAELSESHYAIAGRAAQIVAWDRDHQHCGRCGDPTERVAGERGRRCARCDLTAYPRVSPAIIVLIERGDQILLARGRAFVPRRFGIIAGFVEPGESLEDAVRREVREEVGIELGGIDYFGSQPWPFPHGIMIGFRATHLRGEITLGDGELAEAGWYDTDGLPEIPAKLSIARRLIDDWADRRGFVIDQP
jgi:NAD+ diphosphatase